MELSGVPSAFQTLLAFAAFIIPGFLLRAGYVRSRARSADAPNLYVLAEAVTGSLFVLAIAWWWRGEQVLGWATSGTLVQHRDRAYWFFLALLIAPYFVGVVAGWAVNFLSKLYDSCRPPPTSRGFRHLLFYWLDTGGVFNGPTLWDDIWEDIGRKAPLILKVRTTGGQVVIGAVEAGTWAASSPQPRELFLAKVYRENHNGVWEADPDSEGMFFHASAIESLEFFDPVPARTPRREDFVPRDEGAGDRSNRSLGPPLTTAVVLFAAGRAIAQKIGGR